MDEKTKKYINNSLKVLFIILAVVVIILTLGWIIRQAKKKEETENKANRLNHINKRIEELEKNKVEIEAMERKIFFYARCIIGIIFMFLNLGYYYFNIKSCDLGAIINFNEAILFSYSLFAFVSYGTPKNLVFNLKDKVSLYLKEKHFDSIEELSQLIDERKKLMIEIEGSEKEIYEMKFNI